ncbi:hypothetical protein HYS54_02135 [Candidatus Micrarchaeota archaeon]|nr:hypothetical protein [Candidatus Micrarchaeota archaeon]
MAIAREALTQKQKIILSHLREVSGKTNVTRLVPTLASRLDCSKSSVWNQLRVLKRTSLVSYGSTSERGVPATLTEAGWLVSKNI